MKAVKKAKPIDQLPDGQRWRVRRAASLRASNRHKVARRFQRDRVRPKGIIGCKQDPQRRNGARINEPVDWGPTQVPMLLRRARRRAANKRARISRKRNR